MNILTRYFAVATLGMSLGMLGTGPVIAANTHTIFDPQEVPYATGYDVKQITFTLNNDPILSLTAEIIPWGIPGDTDGDGDPNASINPSVIDEPGVGSLEFMYIAMECGATDVSAGCIPNVYLSYNNNTLSIVNTLTAADLSPYVTFTMLSDRYVMTITDLMAFKAALGIPTTAVNFGAFSVVASYADNAADDEVPDNGACEAVHLEPPLTTCNLVLQKTASVSTVGPILVPVSNESDNDDSDGSYGSHNDSHNDRNHSGDSDDSDSEEPNLTCGCKGKVSSLTLRYTGTTPTSVKVDRLDPFGVNLKPMTAILPGDEFTVNGSQFGPKGFRGTLGTSIRITESDGDVADLHTSCSEPIGPGTVAGDFVVESGQSKKLSVPLCPMAPPAGCPANQQVTYTYAVTNNGSAVTGLVVTDDKMPAPVGGPVNLAQGASTSFTAEACLYETTTNIASATSMLSNGQACASNTSSVTVVMQEPVPPTGECDGHHNDSDSDSGWDANHNSDSDDSDADSGTTDCDGDSDALPPPPPVYHGCGPDYWSDHKKHKKGWGKHKPDDRFDATFGVDASGNKGLLKCLDEKDRKGSKDLQRHAVAAWLNANDKEINYFYNPGEVVAIVNNAYKTKDYDGAKRLLKQQNEAGCPKDD